MRSGRPGSVALSGRSRSRRSCRRLVTEVAIAPIPATLAMVYLGVFPSAIAFVSWAYVLQRSTAGATASATLAVPAIVVLMSWLMLGELPTMLGMIGGVVCLAGVQHPGALAVAHPPSLHAPTVSRRPLATTR